MNTFTLVSILFGVQLGVGAVAWLIRVAMQHRQKTLEAANKPEPMAVSLILSSADHMEEEQDEQRIGHQ